jgi:PAS domain S-box-containing protein
MNEEINKSNASQFVQLETGIQFEAIFEYATEGIIVSDNQSRIVKINPSCLKMFGYDTEQELIGKSIEILIPQRYKTSHVGLRNHFVSEPKPKSMGANRELFALKKDNREFPVEISLSPFKTNGSTFVICFIIDITPRKKAEENEKNYRIELENEVEERTLILKEAVYKLEKTKNKLDQSLKREQEANSMKTKFISIASHEFRTPLSTVLSSISLVEKYSDLMDYDKRAKHIERIKKSVKNLTDILNDILSVNKIEEGKVEIKPETFSIDYFIKDLKADLIGLLKPSQEIILNIDHVTELSIVQDPKLLRHILINLLSNAIKFSEEGKIILLEAFANNENLIIKVIDHGIGIPKADQNKLFTRFFRSGNVENIQGTGLGLSIVLQYVEYLKGSIKFESEETIGTTFTLEIPKTFK